MQIYVCVKHVPDSAANIRIIDQNRIDDNIACLLNPFDEHAVTEAGNIKKKLPASEIIAVCFGREDAEKTLRSALAMGADRGILIVSNNTHDSIVTARVLKAGIEQDGSPDLIFTGKESIDAEGMQTMFRMGSLFDFPVATNVVKLDIKAHTAVADSELSGGIVNTYEMTMPCIIGAGRSLNTPRYPTFPDVVKSKKKPITKINFADLDIKTQKAGIDIVGLEPFQQSRQPKEITGSASEAAREILRILKEEAKVI